MNARTRLTLSRALLLDGAVTTACGSGGGGGAPADASEKEVCDSRSGLMADLLPDDLSNPEMPSNEEMV